MGIVFKALGLGIAGTIILVFLAELFIPPLKPVSASQFVTQQKK
jgi:hypothetical protein